MNKQADARGWTRVCVSSAGSFHRFRTMSLHAAAAAAAAAALSVLLNLEPFMLTHVDTFSFFLSLTKQNRCRQPWANIPSFSFPRGKVPFSLPG